jgi:aminopeptidase N
MYQSAKGIVAVPDDRLPIVHRGFSSPEEQFSFRAYPKGSWILHMLRHQLGEDLYRKCVQTYVERHKFGVVETEDLVRVIEELSGRSFDAFFDQYVYHAQQPDLRITYEWLEKEKLAKVSVTQNQPTSPEVLLFQIPVKFRFGGKAGTVDREWTLKDKSAEFYAALPHKPDWVRFDPEFSVLAKVSFDLPFPLLAAQLANASDLIGRLEAIAQLARKKDSASVDLLKKVLLNDSFYGARIEASKALRQIDTPDARLALQSGLVQADARVRVQVLGDVTRPYREESLGQALRTLGQEKNPDILASAIRSLGAYSPPPDSRLPPGVLEHQFLPVRVVGRRRCCDATASRSLLHPTTDRRPEIQSGSLADRQLRSCLGSIGVVGQAAGGQSRSAGLCRYFSRRPSGSAADGRYPGVGSTGGSGGASRVGKIHRPA